MAERCIRFKEIIESRLKVNIGGRDLKRRDTRFATSKTLRNGGILHFNTEQIFIAQGMPFKSAEQRARDRGRFG